MKCITILYTSFLFCLAFVLHFTQDSLDALHNWTAKRSGKISLLCSWLVHDQWPYKMQLVRSDYMLATHWIYYHFFSFIWFSKSVKFLVNFQLKLSFETLELEREKSATEPTGEMRNSLWLLKHEWTFSITSINFKMAKPSHRQRQNSFSSHTLKSSAFTLASS